MERNIVMSYPVPPDFSQQFFLNGTYSCKKRLKTVMTGLDRQERVIQACQNIRIPRHSLSQLVFSMFSHHFSSVFGLFTVGQGMSKRV